MSPAQHRLLTYIDTTIKATGICPSYAEMQVALNVKSKSSIAKLVDILVRDGLLNRKPYSVRSLTVVPKPEPQVKQLQARVFELIAALHRADTVIWHAQKTGYLPRFEIDLLNKAVAESVERTEQRREAQAGAKVMA
jgi:SOS-response transcriptional repressor LexA